ncbi:sorbitol dehydrogenase family protein [Silvimonas sp.]|uniref:sorbitol dehydrogenase family protein n=1 Tax=Silvimonas sp. TaxID=2650811 RepID=UPI0028407A30|nr:sorbitol dehydrogenase family protein [Silvimonas sp.]MDR3427426.1 sorbitol dehydrogenase family protein [Silvimonas sp.]
MKLFADAQSCPPQPERRRLLLAAGITLGALTFSGSLVRRVFADTTPQSAAFLNLSQLLTGRKQLDAGIAQRFFSALGAQDNNFADKVMQIAGEAQTNSLHSVDELATALDQNKPELAKTLHSIIGAWYTGVVGEGANAVVITYADALMFDPVKDATAPPSYCHAAPLYWSAKPPLV